MKKYYRRRRTVYLVLLNTIFFNFFLFCCEKFSFDVRIFFPHETFSFGVRLFFSRETFYFLGRLLSPWDIFFPVRPFLLVWDFFFSREKFSVENSSTQSENFWSPTQEVFCTLRSACLVLWSRPFYSLKRKRFKEGRSLESKIYFILFFIFRSKMID